MFSLILGKKLQGSILVKKLKNSASCLFHKMYREPTVVAEWSKLPCFKFK